LPKFAVLQKDSAPIPSQHRRPPSLKDVGLRNKSHNISIRAVDFKKIPAVCRSGYFFFLPPLQILERGMGGEVNINAVAATAQIHAILYIYNLPIL
jgi:hypothetical protein